MPKFADVIKGVSAPALRREVSIEPRLEATDKKALKGLRRNVFVLLGSVTQVIKAQSKLDEVHRDSEAYKIASLTRGGVIYRIIDIDSGTCLGYTKKSDLLHENVHVDPYVLI